MAKKYLMCILCVIFVFTLSTSVFAQPDTSTATEDTVRSEQPMPGGMGGRGGGRQGGMGGGQPPENMTPPENIEGMQKPDTAPEMPEPPQGDKQFTAPQEGEASENAEMQMPDKGNRGNMMPDNVDFGNESRDTASESKQSANSFISFIQEYQTPVISVILLLLAFVFVKLYKRKSY